MSNSTELKEYLVGTKDSFLFDESNNGKTIMLSGAWGAGKTHFWINEVEPKLSNKLNDKASIYVSLYGKTDIEDIRSEILMKAYSETTDENVEKYQKKAISALNLGGKILSSVSAWGVSINSEKVSEATSNFFNDTKMKKAIEYISDGGVICLDDFERKSEKISLNDLFGFISQLSLDMNCKVVIILNSDVFTGEETITFKTVKEKTVSKYFCFSPSIRELFESIFQSNTKYESLEDHKETIITSIEDTKELNARLYVQVLDNCLEWVKKDNDAKALRALSLATINFTLNHFVFSKDENQKYNVLKPLKELDKISKYFDKFMSSSHITTSEAVINDIRIKINTNVSSSESEEYYKRHNGALDIHKHLIKTVYFFSRILKIENGIDKKTFEKVNNFVSTGILN